MKTGRKIRKIRRENEITQLELCSLAGGKYTQTMLSKIELGERKLTIDEIKDFAKALNISIYELIEE